MKKLLVCLVALCLCFGAYAALAEAPADHTHEKGDLIVDTEPSCTKTGIGHYECTIEGCDWKSDPVEIPMVDHVPGEPDEEDLKKDPTCTEPGHEAQTHCAMCGEIIEGGEVIPALGHDFVLVPAKEATCTEDGYNEHKACSRCGEIDPAHPKTVIPAKGHGELVPAEEYTAPDCTATEPLSVAAKCSVCGELVEEKILIPVGEHKWEEVEGKEPTCTEDGYEAYKQCSVCGKTDPDPIVVIKALGHDFSVYQGALAGDCTHDGRLAGLYCSRCGEPENEGIILPAPGHKAVKVAAVPPTCTEEGLTEGEKCSVCGETLVEQEKVPALGHDWETILGTKATCTEAGVGAHRLCKRCGEIEWADPEKKVIPAHGHSNVVGFWPEYPEYQADGTAGKERTDKWTVVPDEELAKQKAATCTEDGYEPAEVCAFCGEVLVPGEVLPALGHDWVLKVPGTLPTCTEEGVSDLWECARCGLTKGGEPINARGHNLKDVAELLPTCTKDGHFAYQKCTNEGCKYCRAKAGAEMIDTRLPEDIQVVATLPGTPGEENFIEDQMPAKGHPKAFVVAKYNHKYVEPVRPVEPTCTEAGIADGATRCIICGKYFNLTALKALGHDIVEVDGYEATCTEDGLKDYVYCSRCGKAVEASNATDEQYQALLTASSIVKPEEGDPAEMIIPAPGHKPAPGVALEPTCTEKGHTAGQFCEVCGMTLQEQEEIAALGHDMKETAAEVAPTCTEPGKKAVMTCTRCGLEEGGEEIPALGHDAGKPTAPKAPTCTEYGFTEGAHCTRCAVDYEPVLDYLLGNGIISGADLYEAGWLKVPELIDPLGHDLSEPKNADPTCEEVGYEDYCECQREGCNYTEGKILPALGHDWIKVPGGEKTAPTCTEAGTDGLQQCDRCKKTEAVVVPALGHDMVKYEAKDPTCVDDGNIAYEKCTRCGLILVDGVEKTEDDVIIPATGEHKWLHLDAEPATCTTPGYTEGQVCEVCGLIVRTEIEADAEAWHDYLAAAILDEEGKLDEAKVAELVAEGLIVDEKPETTAPGSGMRVIKCAACGYPLYVELYPAVLKGDVNMDGYVTPTDALLVLQYYAGVISSVPNLVAADFNEDGNVTPSDALGILQYYAAN